jgi:antitoxin VapB
VLPAQFAVRTHVFLGFANDLCYFFFMINLSQETEALAKRLAAVQRLSVEAVIRQALEARANVAGMASDMRPRRRMTVEQMLAVGSEIAAMPLLDARSPREIIDDINAL